MCPPSALQVQQDQVSLCLITAHVKSSIIQIVFLKVTTEAAMALVLLLVKTVLNTQCILTNNLTCIFHLHVVVSLCLLFRLVPVLF